jgi:hypothetical protein
VTTPPDITEVQRLRLEPGDRLVVTTNRSDLSQHEATVTEIRVRELLALPDDVPVLVLPRGYEVGALKPEPG